MKLTTNQLRRIIREEVSKVLAESAGLSAEMLGIDLGSLNPEQKRFLDNLLAMGSDQLASQYSDITKEMSGRRSMVPLGTPDAEVIKMILDEAYPELDIYGYEPSAPQQSLSALIKNKMGMNEAMTRITEDEIAAWKKGDWGYVSGDNLSEATSPSIESVIQRYKQDPAKWNLVANEFADMAGVPEDNIPGGDGGGVRDYYPGWEDSDFQAVLDAMADYMPSTRVNGRY